MSAKATRDRLDGFYGKYGKRIFDLVLAIPSIVILSPIFLLCAVLIKIETSGPVFFTHERIGRGWKPFRLYKFRTMVKDASRIGPLITSSSDPRITRVGRILRKFKIDEMPQIINVIKGDMSVIGPRPEVRKYVEAFRDDYEDVLRIKPGMTDYALIAFRNEEEILSKFENMEEGYLKEVFPKKIELYKKYMEEMSLLTDVKIFFKTILEILRH